MRFVDQSTNGTDTVSMGTATDRSGRRRRPLRQQQDPQPTKRSRYGAPNHRRSTNYARPSSWFLLTVALMALLAAISSMHTVVAAQESIETVSTTTTEGAAEGSTTSGEGGTNATADSSSTVEKPKRKEEVKDDFNAKDHLDWGTYYDPKNIFCGQYDCYKILGFDYENYGKEKPTTKVITKRYRALSREWHPDKSKHKDAKERFTKIARAYEVLTNIETRREYDAMRYDPEIYFRKYGSSVLWQYAPKSDTFMVILFIVLAVNGFGLFAQYNRWQNVADRLARAAVEDWSTSQGGTPESRELREHAVTLLAERQEKETTTGDDSNGTASDKKSKKGPKLTNKEKKDKENEELRPIIKELAYEIEDFGAGFHKPSWKDLIIVKVAKFPFHFGKVATWQIGYWIRRIQKLDLTDEEKAVLTERAVGHVVWELATEEQRQVMIGKELWILDNLAEYKDEQEFNKLSKTEQKNYNRYAKRNKGDKSTRRGNSDLAKED